jgi:hypothetical protein
MLRILLCICLLSSRALFASHDQVDKLFEQKRYQDAVVLILFPPKNSPEQHITTPVLKELYWKSRAWDEEKRTAFINEYRSFSTLEHLQNLVDIASRTLKETGRQGAFHGQPFKWPAMQQQNDVSQESSVEFVTSWPE